MSEMYEPILIVRESVAKCENARLVAVAHGCGVSVEAAQAAVLKMWAWARRHAKDGAVENVQPEFIDKLVGIQGLAQALVDNRWLTRRTTGIEFPEWNKYLSSDSSAKALANARLKRHRERRSGEPPPDETPVKRDGVSESPTPPVVIGGLFGHLPEGKAVQTAWDEFCQHRLEKDKKGWTQRAKDMNARIVHDILKRRGPVVAIKALENSVAGGWTKVYEPAQTTEHDMKVQAQTTDSTDRKAWWSSLTKAEQDAMLAEYRATVPAKEQDKPGAFGRWCDERRVR